MRKALLLAPLILLLSTELLAQNVPVYTDAKGALKFLRENRRELLKKVDKSQKQESLFEYYTHAQDCSNCPREMELTRDINAVLQKLPLDDPQAEERIADLEFAFVTVMSQAEQKSVCYDLTRFGMEDLPNEFKMAETELLLETQLDPAVTSKYIYKSSNNTRRIYYYRGKGKEKDLVIKVEIEPNGPSHVSVIKLKTPLRTQFEKIQASIPDLNPTPAPNPQPNLVGYDLKNDTKLPEQSNFQKCLDISSKIEKDSDGIWKDAYVKQDCTGVLYENYNIENHNEINSKRAQIDLRLTHQDKILASSEIKLNHGSKNADWKASIPLDLTIPAEIIREKSGDRIYTVLNASKTFDNKVTFTAGVRHENGKNNIELALEKALRKCEKVKVKYTNNNETGVSSPTVWVTYENSICR